MTKTVTETLAFLGVSPAAATHAEYLENWSKVKDIAKALSDLEKKMRVALFQATFPNPEEGTNTFELQDGRKLKATHKINRSIDETQIALARSEFALLNEPPVVFDDLLKTKFELVTSAYRKLEPDTQPFKIASRMITSKPGTPALELK